MKKIYILISLLFCINVVFSQVVFTDNFNTSTGSTYTTTVGAIGSSAVWNMNRSGVDWGAKIDNNILDCTNDGSASGNVNGWVFANTSTAAFSSPYSTTLNTNTSAITWTFNMRQIRTDPAGFGAGSYGVAFILAGSSNNGASGSTGYAVALGQSGTTDPIRLIKYNNGLQGTIANIITSNTAGLKDFGNNYLSIKVIYIPSSDTWELFVRDDGATAFSDPSVGVLTSQGTAVDNTFTGQVLGFLGGYWQGSTGAVQTAFFDNINVSLASTNSANSDIISNATFTTPSNINYSQYQGTVLTLANSIEVAKFTIRDGGAAADADGVGTILNSISFNLSNAANIRRVAIMDGTTQLQELAGAATINFTGLTLTAPDDGTKDFSLRVVFANNVTDNQQFQFTIASTSTNVAGSSFAATNAGGASSSIAGDDNKVEVIADGLSYLTNTFSPTGNGVAMAPAVQIGGTDTLNFGGNLYTNLDLDFNQDVSITSTGTLTGSPVIVTAIAGVAAFNTLVHTVNGTALTLTAKRNATNDWDAISNPFDIINSSTATDYFRSVQTGNWNNPSTWESSANNVSWQASTLVPNSSANNIYIRNTHTVTITSSTSADQLIIENGGTLIQNNTPVFTIDNGTATYDMLVDIGGTFVLNGRQPVGLGSIGINGGGTILVASNPSPAEGDDFAFGNVGGVASVVFFTNSNYNWGAAASTPSWTGRTYFTSGNSTFFRFLVTPNFNLGGASPTVINGVLVAVAPITIIGTGTKTFVNGIINAALIDASLATGGSINITGINAELGDIGTVLLPPAGLNIGPNTTVSCLVSPLTPTKTINGNVSFAANTKVFLTDTDLTITENITGTNSTSYFITNGLSNAGKLIRPNIGATPVEFPIGHSSLTYNPVTINNGNNLSYGVKVYNSIQPTSVYNDNNLVNRTWVIIPSNTPGGPVNVTFNYGAGDGNPGFNFASNVEVGLHTGVWNVIQTNISPSGTYNVTTNVSAFGANIDAPMVIGNLGAILTVSKKVTLTATKQNNTSLLTWQSINLVNAKSYFIERSSNGINFTNIATNNSTAKTFIDANPLGGNNYYRIKCVEQDNAVTYSNVIIVRHKVDVVSISPSITATNTILTINSGTNQKIAMVITDALGKRIKATNIGLTVGENKLPIQASGLSGGLYLVTIYFENGTKVTSRFIKQ
jgi:hypothetical protein